MEWNASLYSERAQVLEGGRPEFGFYLHCLLDPLGVSLFPPE